jgi:hypothetical protein
MWANLTSLVQQLLQQTVLQPEEVLSTSLAMAGALADTATSLLQANSSTSSSNGGTGGQAEAASSPPSQQQMAAAAAGARQVDKAIADTAVLLLEFTAQLLDQTKSRAAALCANNRQQHPGPEDDALLVQQVAEIQQQVSYPGNIAKGLWAPCALRLANA